MTGRVATALRGFLLHDPDFSLGNLAAVPASPGATDSDYSAADPRPGIAEPADPLATCTVRAHNAQDADLLVASIRPGLPTIDGSGFAYRENIETATEVRGWNEPNSFQGYYPVEIDATEEWQSAQLVTMPTTGNVVAVAADILGGTEVSSWTWDCTTRTWSSRVTVGGLSGADICCAFRLRGTNRIIAFFADKAAFVVKSAYSDDEGATWSQYGADAGVGFTVTANTTTMKAAQDRNGVILVVLTDSAGDFESYASKDGGHNFEALEASGSALGIRHDLFELSTGQLALVYREDTSADGHMIVLDDAYDSIASKIASPTVEFDASVTVDYIVGCTDFDGISYVYLGLSSSDNVQLHRSVDGGATWQEYIFDPFTSASSAHAPVTDLRIRPRAVAPTGGEILMLANSLNASTSPAEDGSLISFVFGGWDGIEHGETTLGQRIFREGYGGNGVAGNGSIFFPSDTIDTYGWTVTGGGHTFVSGVWSFAAGGTATYAEQAFTAPGASEASVYYFAIRVVSGATTSGLIRVRRGTFGVALRGDTSGFSAFDLGTGGQFGSTVNENMTGTMLIKVVFADEDTVTVFYKRPAASEWTKGPQKNGLVSGAASTTVRIGVIDNVTMVLFCQWFAWKKRAALYSGSPDLPYYDDLAWGKALGSRPYPVRDQGGSRVLHLSAAGGHTRQNEQWSIPAAYDHGIAEIFPQSSPGPDARWRSVDTTEQRLVWDLTGAGRNTRLGTSWSIGLCLVATNFRTAVLEYRVAGGVSNVELGTWDATVERGLSFQRSASGELLIPATTGTAARKWWRAGFLAGGTAILDPSGTPVLRRIRWNSAGGWSPNSNMPPVLELEGVDGTEPTSGTLDVIAPGGVLLLHLPQPVEYRRLQLRIPAQDTAEGYVELGNLIAGSLIVPGRQWSRGYSWRIGSKVIFEEDDRGVLWPDRRGVAVRELTVAWQDGGDLSDLRNGPSAPYLAPNDSGPALAGRHDVHWQLEAMERLTRGGTLPVVALPDCGGPSGRMILEPDMWLYGLKRGDPQANHVVGDDGKSEVYRGESITIREQPWTRWEL